MTSKEHDDSAAEQSRSTDVAITVGMRKRAWDILRSLPQRVVDTLLPPTCLSCEAGVARPGVVCPQCWSDIRFIEKPYCRVLGTPFSYDLGPGALSAQAIAHPPAFDQARSAVLYDPTARRLVQGLKFSDRTELAPWMAWWMKRAIDDIVSAEAVVIPVPLHNRRLFKRRFNQAAELARNLARQNDLAYRPQILLRSKATRQQVGLGTRERHRNVQGAFRVPAEKRIEVADKHIILVDDVYTTGATLQACARTLRRYGARKIDCVTFARVANGVAVDDL